jgi:uncharacterized repeat protein (TIGR02543 family)
MNMKKTSIYFLTVILTAFLSLALVGCDWLFPAKKDKMYEITFVYNNGEPDTVISVKSGESVYAPPSPKKNGYVFERWYTDANFNSLFSDGSKVYSNLTLYANYRKIYNISGGIYDYTSGLPVEGCSVEGTGAYPSGTRVTLSANIVDGYVFEGFYLDGVRFSSSLVQSLTVNADAVYDVKVQKGVYVRVEVGDIKGGKITINDADVSSWSTLEGGRAVVRAEKFAGYNFEGFYDADKNLYTSEPQFEIVLRDNAVFTAKFSYIEYQIEVASSDDEAGTVSFSPVQSVYRVGDTITVTSVPVGGNILKGLFVEVDGAAAYLSSSTTVRLNLIDLINIANGKTSFKIFAEFEATDFSDEYYDYQKISGGIRIIGVNKPFDSGNVVVPASIEGLPVLQISASAFAGRDDITAITLPASLKSFTGNTNPFEYCKNLSAIYVDLAGTAFSSADGVLFNKDKTKLVSYPCAKTDENYTPPSSVKEIGAAAFGGQRFLKNFSAAGLTEIANYAFRNSAVETFSADGSPASFNIGEFAFLDCVNLTAVETELSGTVKGAYKVSRFAFSGCRNLSSVVLNGIKEFKEEIFSGCISLTEITVPKTLTAVTGDAFGGAGLVNIYADAASTNFEDVDGVLYKLYNKDERTLVRCPEKHINSVRVKEGTLSIESYAFKNVSLVTSVDMADASVAAIGAEAFMNAASVYSLEMGNKVKTIGNYGFFGCAALSVLTVSPTLETVGEYAFSNAGITYLDMGSGLKKSAATAFDGMKELLRIDFPNTVTDLGDRYGGVDGELPIFVNCPKLTEINVAEGGTVYTSSIDDEEHNETGGILYKGATYTTGGTTTFVEREMVLRCPEGKTGTVWVKSKNLEKIASGAFSNSQMSRIFFNFDAALSQKLTVIGRQAFSFAEQLTAISIPSSVTRIGDDAFLGCKSLAEVVLPTNLQRVGDFAFSGCNLEEITIPESVQYVYAFAFYGNKNLKRVFIRKTTAPSTTTFRGYANIFGGHNAEFKIYVMMSKSGEQWTSNISNYTGRTGWNEYVGSYKNYNDEGYIEP